MHKSIKRRPKAVAHYPSQATFTWRILLLVIVVMPLSLKAIPRDTCPPAYGITALLRPNGLGSLNWLGNPLPDSTEVEFRTLDQPLLGQGNYFSDSYVLLLPNLDYSKDYYARLRPVCTPPTAWSDTLVLLPIFDCAAARRLLCGQTARAYIGKGVGLTAHQLGVPCWGQERYFTFTATTSNMHTISVKKLWGKANIRLGVINGCTKEELYITTASPTYLPPVRLFLYNGQTYTIVLDNPNEELSGEFEVSITCAQPSFDQPFDATTGALTAEPLLVNAPCRQFSNQTATTSFTDPQPTVAAGGNWKDGPEHSVWFWFEAPPSGTVRISMNATTQAPMDPQVTLVRADSTGTFPKPVMASGEDLPNGPDALIHYTGLQPGQKYLIMADGASGSQGIFCIQVTEDLQFFNRKDTCFAFAQTYRPGVYSDDWINFYASDDPAKSGPLLAAIQTQESLGKIVVSVVRTDTALALPDGTKLLPRYFNISVARQPQFPVRLRLFFNHEDLRHFRLSPPVDTSVLPSQLGITHYSGSNQDCNPANNPAGAGLAVEKAVAYAMSYGNYYLESTITHFSEFGIGKGKTIATYNPYPQETVSVWPVPTRDNIAISVYTTQPLIVHATLLQVAGGVAGRTTWRAIPGQPPHEWSLSGLSPGIYWLSLRSVDGVLRTMSKIVVSP